MRTATDGDLVATRIQATGNHTGDGLRTAIDKPVALGRMIISRIRDGQIAEGWNCIDFLTMDQQLGLVSYVVS